MALSCYKQALPLLPVICWLCHASAVLVAAFRFSLSRFLSVFAALGGVWWKGSGPGPRSGPGPDNVRQRGALQLQMVLVLTLTLTLVLTLTLTLAGQKII